MNKIEFLDLKKINLNYLQDFHNKLDKLLNEGWFVLGKNVSDFELNYANFSSTQFSIGVANGLDALILSLKSLNISTGDEVIVPSNTYIATWLAVSHLGATPVPVEPNFQTYNLDPTKIESAITNKTKAILVVNLYGQAAELDSLKEIADKHNLFLLEDNAQAQGAKCNNKATGSYGIVNATSFYPGKNLGALGDAGAITTNDEILYKKILELRNYGSNIKYKHDIVGYNMRLDELQAAFLITKLKYLQEWNNLRNLAANYYKELLSDVKEIYLPFTSSNSTHTYHLFVIRTNYRNELMKYLESKGIGVLIHYPIPPHLQKALSFLNYKVGDFPIAEELSNTMLSLPMWPGITKNDIELVCNEIKSFFNEQ
jgi:dTDP-4-amino-4,6-dideoxygalactose transaminase